MDKIKRSVLNQNFRTADVHYMQDSYTDAVKGLSSPYSYENTYILSGCEITTSTLNHSISAGFIVINGEVCKVDQHVCPLMTRGELSTYYWVVETNKPVEGIRQIQSGGNSSTWENRRGKLIKSGILRSVESISGDEVFDPLGPIPAPVEIPLLDTNPPNIPTIHELIATKTFDILKSKEKSLRIQTFETGWSGNIYLNKDPFGYVHGYLQIDGDISSTSTVVNLPSGWKGYFQIPRSDGSAYVSLSNGTLTTAPNTGGNIYASFSYKATS